jgi:adenosine/AMP kinase
MTTTYLTLSVVAVDKPDEVNLILGQSHFIKSVEDLHETLVGSVPGISFGLAFCESSGPRLVRRSGTAPELTELAVRHMQAIGAGHSFLICLGNAFPLNVLNAVKSVPEVCHIFCATANPVQVVVGETDQGRGILGVIDGQRPLGVEDAAAAQQRKDFLREVGYKQ